MTTENGQSQSIVLGNFARSIAGPAPKLRLDADDLAAWIRDKYEALRCRCFRLDHDSSEGKGRTGIGGFVIPKRATPAEAAALIERQIAEFSRASESYAAVYPMMQRFFVGAVVVKQDVDDKALFAEVEYPFLVTPPEGVSSSFHQREEDVNLPAVVGHLQRLVDRFGGLLATNMQEDKDRYVKMLDSVMTRYEALMDRCFSMAGEREKLLDSHAERELRVHRTKMDIELTNKLYMALTTYGLGFLKRYLDMKGLGERDKGAETVIASMRELDPPHLLEFVHVVNGLPEAQKEKLAPIFDAVVSDLPADKKAALHDLLVAEMQKTAAAGESPK